MRIKLMFVIGIFLFVTACQTRSGSGSDQSPAVETQTSSSDIPERAPTESQISVTAAPISTSRDVLFLIQGSEDESILPNPTSPDFEGLFEGLGTVFFHDGTYHMFYNDLQGNWPPNRINVGYATSSDGLSWVRDSEQHVFSADEVPYLDTDQLLSRTVFVEDDGTWVMYFDTVSAQMIGRATAPGPRGPWTADPEPLLMAGDELDPVALTSPSVVKTDDGYFMYYASFEGDLNFGGANGNPHSVIRLATSPDGIQWTKMAEPVFTYTGGEEWDFYKAESPSVVVTPDGWVLLYRADSGHFTWGSKTGYGLAVSSDGIHWERVQNAPVLSEDDSKAISTLWSVVLAYNDGTYFIYCSADGRGFNGTQMYVSTYDGSLPFSR